MPQLQFWMLICNSIVLYSVLNACQKLWNIMLISECPEWYPTTWNSRPSTSLSVLANALNSHLQLWKLIFSFEFSSTSWNSHPTARTLKFMKTIFFQSVKDGGFLHRGIHYSDHHSRLTMDHDFDGWVTSWFFFSRIGSSGFEDKWMQGAQSDPQALISKELGMRPWDRAWNFRVRDKWILGDEDNDLCALGSESSAAGSQDQVSKSGV